MKQAPENLLKPKGTCKIKRAIEMMTERGLKTLCPTQLSSYNIHTPFPNWKTTGDIKCADYVPAGVHPHFLTQEILFTITIEVRAKQTHLIMEEYGKASTRAQGPSNIQGSV